MRFFSGCTRKLELGNLRCKGSLPSLVGAPRITTRSQHNAVNLNSRWGNSSFQRVPPGISSGRLHSHKVQDHDYRVAPMWLCKRCSLCKREWSNLWVFCATRSFEEPSWETATTRSNLYSKAEKMLHKKHELLPSHHMPKNFGS